MAAISDFIYGHQLMAALFNNHREVGLVKLTSLYFITKPTRGTNFTNLFWHETLHVSESSSVHHQEFIHCTLSSGTRHTGL